MTHEWLEVVPSLDWVKGDETVFRLPDGDEEEGGEEEQEDCQAGGDQEEDKHPGVQGEEGAPWKERDGFSVKSQGIRLTY